MNAAAQQLDYPAESRVRRSAWSFGSTLLLGGLTVLTGFLVTPLLLRWISTEEFGAYRILTDWFNYVVLFEFGLGGSLAAVLAPALGRRDEREVGDILSAGLRAYGRVVPLVVSAGILFAMLLPALRSFQGLDAMHLRIATLILIVPCLWLPLSVFRTLAEARQRLYVVNGLLAAQAALTAVLLVFAARAGWGVAGLALATVAAQAPPLAVLVALGVRRYGRALLAGPNPETSKRIWSLNWPTFALTLSGRLGLLSDNIVVGMVLGPAAVAPFYLTQRLASLAQTQLQGIGNATWAGLVELFTQNRMDTFRARLLELTELTSGLAIAVLAPIAAFSRHFIGKWVGAGLYAGDTVAILACVNVWLLAIFSLWGWPITGTGNIRRWLPFALLFTGVNVGCSVVGALLFGMAGPLVGTMIAFLAVNAWAMPRVLRSLFGVAPKALWHAALKTLRWGAPFAAVTFLLSSRYPPAGWFGLAAGMGLAVLAGLGSWWTFGMDRDDRASWAGRFRTVAGR